MVAMKLKAMPPQQEIANILPAKPACPAISVTDKAKMFLNCCGNILQNIFQQCLIILQQHPHILSTVFLLFLIIVRYIKKKKDLMALNKNSLRFESLNSRNINETLLSLGCVDLLLP